jgi:hypothetical protein
MKTKTIPDEPILIGELIRRRPIAQTSARVESEYKCSSSESATSPQRTKTLFSDRQEQAKALSFYRLAITKFFYHLVMNKQKRHLQI